jgi:hypothetical protein
MGVALPSCAHLGPLEFPPPGTDLAAQECPDNLPFDGHRKNFYAKSPADISFSVHFHSRGPLPKSESRRSLLYMVRMPIIFPPRRSSVCDFLEVFSVSDLLLG